MASADRDRRILYAAALLRALACGMVGVVIGLHLAARGFDPGETGALIGVGLAGAAVAALIVTVAGDRLGRRRTLIVLAALLGRTTSIDEPASLELPMLGYADVLGATGANGGTRTPTVLPTGT
jgi:MFS family permease